MVVHCPRTVWRNYYAEHKVTGKTYNLKKKENYLVVSQAVMLPGGSGGRRSKIYGGITINRSRSTSCISIEHLVHNW